jgi:hypothetical protein
MIAKEWFQVLSKADLIHILEGTRSDLILDGFRRNVAADECHQCRGIAIRLNRKSKATGITVEIPERGAK